MLVFASREPSLSLHRTTLSCPRARRSSVLACVCVLSTVVSCVSTTDPPPPPVQKPTTTAESPAVAFSRAPVTRTLTVVHAADLESAILVGSAAREAGGIARASSLRHALVAASRAPVIVLAAGDTMLPAPELKVDIDGENAVLAASHLLAFQATALGNHEFDLGESFLAEIVSKSRFAYVASTIEVDSGPLRPLMLEVASPTPFVERTPGRILPRGRVCAGELVEREGTWSCAGTTVGLVGAVTASLRQISNLPSHIHVRDTLPAIAEGVQHHVDALVAEGVDIVVLVSHLQGVHKELELIELGLRGVDLVVAGGGDNRLAEPADRLLAGHSPDARCASEKPSCYPLVRQGTDGAPIVVVATDGQLLYLGQVTVGFDAAGVLTHVDETATRPWPVDERSLLELRAELRADGLRHETRVAEALAPLMAPLATTEVFLDGIRENVRNHETNLGNLSADAMLYVAHAHNAPEARIALRNGGGIRAPIGGVDATTHKRTGGTIRRLDVETSFRFDNPLVVVEITHEELRRTLESALREAGTTRGHFPQVSGDVELRYADGPDQTHVLSDGKTTALGCPGLRVQTLRIRSEGGVMSIVENGIVPTPDATISVVTLDYLARGGDGWFPLVSPTSRAIVDGSALPLTEQRAFIDYISALAREGTWDDGRAYREIAPNTGQRIVALHDSAGAPTTLPAGCARP